MIETKSISILVLLLCALFVHPSPVRAERMINPPQDPTQSIVYWKQFEISSQDNRSVQKVHQIFQRLLQAWDSTRLAPTLFVVKSDAGPWAASLADGSILLSYDAIETCYKNTPSENQGDSRVAFVLAHELAHQRTDDLWHRKFFRLAGNQTPSMRKRLLQGLESAQELNNIEEKEVQADRDGVAMVAMVGYDPYAILGNNDFFTLWVESIWSGTCKQNQATDLNNDACGKAQTRSIRMRARLNEIANQATLFELGMQAYVAANYALAREYFTGFGRDYSGRSIHINIGLTYLGEATQIIRRLTESKNYKDLVFIYPVLLEHTPKLSTPINMAVRGQSGNKILEEHELQRYLTEIKAKLELATNSFEQAIKISPDYNLTYLHLAATYLMMHNTFMARGILQGKYVQKFGEDLWCKILLILTSAKEGNLLAAKTQFEAIIAQDFAKPGPTDLNQTTSEMIMYSVYYNFNIVNKALDPNALELPVWQKAAHLAKQQGNSVLFRLALNQLNGKSKASARDLSHDSYLIDVGQIIQPASTQSNQVETNDFWLQGEKLQYMQLADGVRLVADKSQRVLSVWTSISPTNSTSNNPRVRVGDQADRPIKAFGLPSRRVYSVRGEYLAYDQLGIAYLIIDNKVNGWFLYKTL